MRIELTYRSKFLYLLIASVALMWIVYILSIKETLRIKKQYLEVARQTERVGNATQSILFYERELSRVDSLVGSDKYMGNYTQEQLLQKISEYSIKEKINILSFPGPHVYIENNYRVFTYQVEISGDYASLLWLLYELETGNNPGVIKSASLYTTKLSGQATPILVLKLFIQDIKNLENENK
ncbi:MAG: hypothetical protein PHE03_10365 [Bacteroidales bacterium]|nr:hypothetical protein [Bacteroidales bacterium]MDD3892689.1 hypothetical protein [Bacteroidales bacterium]